jgi:hypothetical protein
MALEHHGSNELDFHVCKCKECGHGARATCMYDDCPCCALEDQFSLLTQMDFDPKAKSHVQTLIER